MEKPSDEIKKARFEWKMMIARCEDKDRWDYSYYGARCMQRMAWRCWIQAILQLRKTSKALWRKGIYIGQNR